MLPQDLNFVSDYENAVVYPLPQPVRTNSFVIPVPHAKFGGWGWGQIFISNRRYRRIRSADRQ